MLFKGLFRNRKIIVAIFNYSNNNDLTKSQKMKVNRYQQFLWRQETAEEEIGHSSDLL